MTGVVVLGIALVAALAFGLYRQRVDGRFAPPSPVPPVPPELVEASEEPSTAWAAIAAAVPEASLGERATFVQFSSAFCAPCRTTRVVLDDVATRSEGVAHVEVDAEQHLALVRELDIRRTPTTLVLDAVGVELTRAAGAPRREQVLAALPAVPQETS
jgi:thiol-disulfide isomerase/thioredoxin